jgi:L-seryl-tRNA(Ser) seleniumtransferase
MKRALRIDKIRLAALEAILKLYRDPDRLPQTLPTLRLFVRPKQDITAVAAGLRGAFAAAVGSGYTVEVVDCSSQIGSGAQPLETLPSAGLAISPSARKGAGTRLEALSLAFRKLPIPVVGRIKDGRLTFDLRCLDDEAALREQLPRLTALLQMEGAKHAPG